MRHVASALLLSTLATGATACQGLPGTAAESRPTRPPAAGSPADAKPHDSRAGAAGTAGETGSVAWVGDAVDLGRRARGEHLRLSVVGQVDPAVGVRAADAPESGNRRIGARTTLLNFGGRPYDASRTRTWVEDEEGETYPAVSGGTLTTGPALRWRTLSAGEQAEGWLLYEVPEDARIVRLHSRVGDRVLAWQLRFPPSR